MTFSNGLIPVLTFLRSHIKPDQVQDPSMPLKAAVRTQISLTSSEIDVRSTVAVAGSAIKWLRDSMLLIKSAAEINTLAAKESDTGGVYFVTAFSGLFAPYWDPGAGGLIIGISQYTTPAHIARATLEANAFQTKAIIESMKLDSGKDLKDLKVDGGMTNGDLAMTILADISGFNVVRPEMRESVLLSETSLNLQSQVVSGQLHWVLPFVLGQRSICLAGILLSQKR